MCETFTDAQIVHDHAQRVVPNWSPTQPLRNSQHTALYTTTGTALFSDLLGGACEGRGVD